MSQGTTIYPYSKANKKNLQGIIPDKMEIAINIKTFNMTDADFRRIGQLEGYDKNKSGFSGTMKQAGVTFQVHHSFVQKTKDQITRGQRSFIQTSVVCTHLNGNHAYRRYYRLGPPQHPSTNGEDNFVSHEEVEEVLKRPNGQTRYDFTINILPDIIIKEIKSSFVDACRLIVQQLKAIAPRADVKTTEIKNNTYAFRYIEMSNNIRVPKVFQAWTVKNDMPFLKIYDPLVDQNVLENLAAITVQTEEMDFKGKTPIAASRVTYERGHRQIDFKLYQHRIKGKAYLKYVHGIEYDVFRIEPTYTSHHVGTKTDIISIIANNRKSFNNAADLRDIFRRLANHTHDLTHSMFGVHYELLDNLEKDERTRKILRPHFSYDEAEEILEHLRVNNCKISIKTLARWKTQDKIRKLAAKGFIFENAAHASGDYFFKRSLLGDRETRIESNVSL